MNSNCVLYVGQVTGRTDTVVRELRDELAPLPVRTMSVDEARGAEFGEPACVVYACDDGGTEALDLFDVVRSAHRNVPFVFVLPPNSDLADILDAEQTAVVRKNGHTPDVSILANRVRSLVDSYRRNRELERERARFETLFENPIHPIVEVEFDDREPIVVRVNGAFEEVFGYEQSEIRGESLDDYVVPPDRQDEATEINDRVLDGEVFSIEVTRVTVDGRRDFLLQNAVHPHMPGEFAMYTDITERKQRERELQRQNERLDRFASFVSHDLRNPLNVASGRLGLLREECDSPHLDAIERAHDRMETLIESTLALTREGANVVDPEPADLGVLTERCWNVVETAEATLLTETEAVIYADEARLQRLLENLFRNAIEHGNDGVTITVGTLENGFYVQDDGPGLPEDVREDVFEPGVSTGEHGIGFGLSIVLEIVEAHGWSIDATAAPDSGARFEITGVEFVDE